MPANVRTPMEAWAPDRIAELTALWNAGKTTAEIGQAMGVSRNAVIGKAHRLGLPARQSPILKDVPNQKLVRNLQRQAAVVSVDEKAGAFKPRNELHERVLCALQAGKSYREAAAQAGCSKQTVQVVAAKALHEGRLERHRVQVVAGAAAAKAAKQPKIARRPYIRIEDAGHGCRYPLGEPRTPQFRFCCQPIGRGVYCEAHRLTAYVPVGPINFRGIAA